MHYNNIGNLIEKLQKNTHLCPKEERNDAQNQNLNIKFWTVLEI